MEGCIASPHWEACNTCSNFHPENGCNVKELNGFHLKCGDFIICDDYENNKSVEQTAKTCRNCGKPYPVPIGKDVCQHCGY